MPSPSRLPLPRALPTSHSLNPNSDENRYLTLLQQRKQAKALNPPPQGNLESASGLNPAVTPPKDPFLYGVLSTRIYCRITCPARLARRSQIVFFGSSSAAESAGFRACKRCRPQYASVGVQHGFGELMKSGSEVGPEASPDAKAVIVTGEVLETQAQVMARICGVVEAATSKGQEYVRGRELARIAGMSVWHFARVFRKIVGVTPREYAVRCREEMARSGWREDVEVGLQRFDIWNEHESGVAATSEHHGSGAHAAADEVSLKYADFGEDFDFEAWFDLHPGICEADTLCPQNETSLFASG